ncbi:hypothetical protein MPLSOD_330025 [Mesorhizobium sp. SOD10]|nr:hypothetical protein MPLSOD_330025 [Mesorhizobium sp. SOD10]
MLVTTRDFGKRFPGFIEADHFVGAHANDGAAIEPFDRIDVELLEEGADVAHIAFIALPHEVCAYLATWIGAVILYVACGTDPLARHKSWRLADLDLLFASEAHPLLLSYGCSSLRRSWRAPEATPTASLTRLEG